MTTTPETATPEPVPVQALREYAAALRGDWSDFDGRSSKLTLNEFADAIVGGERAGWTIEQWRADNSICPTLGNHWTEHCHPSRCGNEEGR